MHYFNLFSSINGILVCYKMCAMPLRPAPPLPPPTPSLHPQIIQGPSTPTTTTVTAVNHKAHAPKPPPPSPLINGLNKAMNGLLLKQTADADQHEYEEIEVGSPIRRRSPHRPAPRPPPPAAVSAATSVSGYNLFGGGKSLTLGTLGSYTELEGVPFTLHPALRMSLPSGQVGYFSTHSRLLDYYNL